MYSEKRGWIGFFLFLIGANITFMFTMIMGVKGMPRRYYDYQQFPEIEPLQQWATWGSYIIFLGAVVVLISWIHGAIWGKKAPQNPWGSRSLEWTHASSPPPPGNWGGELKIPEKWDPYGYGK